MYTRLEFKIPLRLVLLNLFAIFCEAEFCNVKINSHEGRKKSIGNTFICGKRQFQFAFNLFLRGGLSLTNRFGSGKKLTERSLADMGDPLMSLLASGPAAPRPRKAPSSDKTVRRRGTGLLEARSFDDGDGKVRRTAAKKKEKPRIKHSYGKNSRRDDGGPTAAVSPETAEMLRKREERRAERASAVLQHRLARQHGKLIMRACGLAVKPPRRPDDYPLPRRRFPITYDRRPKPNLAPGKHPVHTRLAPPTPHVTPSPHAWPSSSSSVSSAV